MTGEQNPKDRETAGEKTTPGIVNRLIGLNEQLIAIQKSNLLTGKLYNIFTGIAALATVVGVAVAIGQLTTLNKQLVDDASKKRIENTLKYVDSLIAPDYAKALWHIQEFTTCFELDVGALGAKRRHLSYRTHDEVAAMKTTTVEIAEQWWSLIENDVHAEQEAKGNKPFRAGYCNLRRDTEESLFLVYSRLEALASCAARGLCDWDVVVHDRIWECKGEGRKKYASQQLIEAFDYFTVLAVSNYWRLSRAASREWDVGEGNIDNLLSRIEKYGMCLMLEKREKTWEGRKGGVTADAYYSQSAVLNNKGPRR